MNGINVSISAFQTTPVGVVNFSKSARTDSVVDLKVASNTDVSEVKLQKVMPKTEVGEKDKSKYTEIINDEVKFDFITETLNELMAQWNADLKFAVHRDTGEIMVKFVNSKTNKVIKEFPPEEYLDMIANIRKYIGNVVDEKI